MIPLAFDFTSTCVTGCTFPVATTDLARSIRSTFAIFSGSILADFVPIALSEKNAALARIRSVSVTQRRRFRFFAAMTGLEDLYVATGKKFETKNAPRFTLAISGAFPLTYKLAPHQ